MVACGTLAGGLGWGIRGQYGHETGAMIAGVLVCAVLVMLLAPHLPWRDGMRAIAMGTIAIGFGGSMTYGQTIGLTHDTPLIGNFDSLRWGMLGLSIKGALWIGFAGLFLGMGLGGVRYRPFDMLGFMILLLALAWIGIKLLNEPFDPANRVLPRWYFSDDWRWEPNAVLKPRREVWGGLLLALAGGWIWAGLARGDKLARQLTFWGALGGAIGFPLGQSLQAFHAWNPESFKTGIWIRLDPFMNWWNFMETTFGLVLGGTLGLGLWLNRKRIAPVESGKEGVFKPPMEWLLLGIHTSLLLAAEFGNIRILNALYDFGLAMAVIPMIAVSGGGRWPLWLIFPVTLLPIAGKTVRELVFRQAELGAIPGTILYGVVPLALALAAVYRGGKASNEGASSGIPAVWSVLMVTWIYFGLNFAFFHFPWPWVTWTSRTPNAIVFTLCAAGLTAAAFGWLRQMRRIVSSS